MNDIDRKFIKQNPEQGVATIEMALILPIMMLLTIVIVELGFGLWNFSTLTYANREGARFAAVNSSEPNVVSDCKNLIIATAAGLHLTNSQINISWNPNQNPGSFVTIITSYSHQPFTGFFNTINLTSTSTLTVSR